jgi:hypothetical protein
LSAKVGRGGHIVLTLKAPAAGSFNALATAAIGKAVAGSRKKVKHKTVHACKITYGTVSVTAPGAENMIVTIKPTMSALSALKTWRTLRVLVTVAFRPRGGSPIAASETVTVRDQPPRRSHA